MENDEFIEDNRMETSRFRNLEHSVEVLMDMFIEMQRHLGMDTSEKSLKK